MFVSDQNLFDAVRKYADALEAEWSERSYGSKNFLKDGLQRGFNFKSHDPLFYAGYDLLLAYNGYPTHKECYKIFGHDDKDDEHWLATHRIFTAHNTHETSELGILDVLTSEKLLNNEDAKRALYIFRQAVYHPATYADQAMNILYWPLFKAIDYVSGDDLTNLLAERFKVTKTIRQKLS